MMEAQRTMKMMSRLDKMVPLPTRKTKKLNKMVPLQTMSLNTQEGSMVSQMESQTDNQLGFLTTLVKLEMSLAVQLSKILME